MSESFERAGGIPKTETYDRWIYYALLVLVVGLPLVISRITLDMFDVPKLLLMRILTLLAVGIWALKILRTRKLQVTWIKLDLVLIGFLALLAIATALSVSPAVSIYGAYKRYEGLLTFINYAAIYFLARQVFNSFDRIKALSASVMLAGVVVSIYGLLQHAGLDPLTWPNLPFEKQRSFSTFGNPDLLGGFLTLALPLALAGLLREKSSRSTLFYGLGFFVISACLLTSYTRGAWVGTILGLLLFFLVAQKASVLYPKRLIAIACILVILFSSLAVYSSSTGASVNLIERIQSAAHPTEGSAGTRLEMWKAAVNAIQERPLFGFGPDTFRLISQKHETLRYVKMVHGQSTADNAHNYLLQLASTTGLPAALLFIVFVFGVIWLSIKAYRYGEGEQKNTYAALTASLAGYVVYLLFGLSVSGNTGLFWLILGALLSQTYFVKQIDLKMTTLSRGIALSSIAIALILTYLALSMFAADYYFNTGLNFKDKGQPNPAISNFQTATGLYKNGLYYDWYARYLQDIAAARHDSPLLFKSKALAETAIAFEPSDADHWIYLANAYAALSTSPTDIYFDEEQDVLGSALNARPYSTTAQLMLADTYRVQGRYDEAVKMLNFVQDIDPSSSDANLLAGQVRNLQSNYASATP